jgi:hypothetical protein
VVVVRSPARLKNVPFLSSCYMLMIRKHIFFGRTHLRDPFSAFSGHSLLRNPGKHQDGMDIEKTASIVLGRAKGVSVLYNRLLLIAGPVASGKTVLLRRISALSGYPMLNVGMELSRQMLELTERQRIIELPTRLEHLVSSQGSDVVLLDNTEFLFLRDLQQDALALLKAASRNRTMVVSWLGTCEREHLQYATPDHREFKRYSSSGLELIELHR